MAAGRCTVCGGEEYRPYHDQGYRRLVRCRGCGLIFVWPLPSEQEKSETERLAYDGALLPETAEFFHNCHRNFREDPVIREFRRVLGEIGEVQRPGRLLDVGPGTGVFLHLARELGWEPHGIDLCPQSATKAAQEFDIQVEVGDFLTFGYEPKSFDCITMLDVVEHTLDPLAFLRRARELLRPGGVLYVAVPNQRCLLTVLLDRYIHLGGPGASWFLERLYVAPHVYYFNPQVLRSAIERASLEPLRLRGGNVYLGRYRLPLWMRVPLEAVLGAGGLLGMSARVLAMARRAK